MGRSMPPGLPQFSRDEACNPTVHRIFSITCVRFILNILISTSYFFNIKIQYSIPFEAISGTGQPALFPITTEHRPCLYLDCSTKKFFFASKNILFSILVTTNCAIYLIYQFTINIPECMHLCPHEAVWPPDPTGNSVVVPQKSLI